MAQILVIEDDKDIAHLTTLHLQDLGHEVEVAHDGEEGLEAALAEDFDLLVLDVMLPGIDGFEICRHVREKKPSTLVLMLTAKSSELDRVLGLELGADDYLSKPFSLRELQARAKALLRRREKFQATPSPASTQITTGGLCIDTDKREVQREGEMINLTAKEFDLLLQFAQHPGKVYTRTQLLDLVWGYGYEGFEHTVNSHINRLRAKLEHDPAKPEYIQTVWGIGYKFGGD
ncbi:MAG: response regulator transcription factor [Trueperaceae bacterium]|nr:response regulator transcription factor [Trueperaceae bacterium]